MVALIVGIILVLFAVYSVLPISGWGLNWMPAVVEFIKGGVPIIALLIGFVAVFIGLADAKDKKKAKEESEEEASEKSSEKTKTPGE
jgi:hypothetical protein